MWQWLQNLSGGAAMFIGSLTGSALGLVALLVGALYNARLNRQRDDRLREVEARGLAAALRAELGGICAALKLNAEAMEREESTFAGPDLVHLVRIYPEVVQNVQLLDVETIRAVAEAYVMIEQYLQTYLMLGCQMDGTSIPNRRIIMVPAHVAKDAAQVNRHTIEEIEKAIVRLDSYLPPARPT
jgi:hypothetical protein